MDLQLKVTFTSGGTHTTVDRKGPNDQFYSLVMHKAREELPGILITLNDYGVFGVD